MSVPRDHRFGDDSPGRHDTVLMEVGDWKLMDHVDSLGNRVTVSLLNSYISHDCPNIENRMYYWYALKSLDDACHGCAEKPDEGIMGLWRLHNMDYIQNGQTY